MGPPSVMRLARLDTSHTQEHDIGAVVTGTAWIYLSIINPAAAGMNPDESHLCIVSRHLHVCRNIEGKHQQSEN